MFLNAYLTHISGDTGPLAVGGASAASGATLMLRFHAAGRAANRAAEAACCW